jgi:hypothetical protein
MVLAAHGVKLSERELRRRTGWKEQFGTSSSAVVKTATALGFVNSRETSGLRLYDLRMRFVLESIQLSALDWRRTAITANMRKW